MTTITPEKLAKLRESIAALQADDIEYEYRSPWYDFGCVVRSCRNDVVVETEDDEAAAYIAAADPQTVLALVEEVERLRAKNAAYHDRLHHPCEGCPGCSSNDCPDALDIAQIDLAEVRDEILRLRDSNAKVTDARDNLLDEVARLQEALADLRSVNEMQGKMLAQGPMDWDERTGLEMAALVHEAVSKALRSYIREMGRMLSVENWTGDPSDMVVQSALSSALQEIKRLQARVAELEAAMAQRMGVYAAPKDERQVGS